MSLQLIIIGSFIVIAVILIVLWLIIKYTMHAITESGGGYTINRPTVLSKADVVSINSNDITTFRKYFQAVYPLLGDDISDDKISDLVFGVLFWYYKVGDNNMMSVIQKYLGEYYSWDDMQKTMFQPPKMNQLFSAPFTPPNLQRNIYDPYGWWNVSFYNGYPDNTYLEGIHGTDTGSGYDVYGYWTYVSPGTGVYMNIGKSLRSHNKLHANYLLHHHQDSKNGLYNFLSLILESCCIGKGWKKDSQGYYTGEINVQSIPNSCPVDDKQWTEPKYMFQVNNMINLYLDQRACINFGGPIPAGTVDNTQPTYKGYASKSQRSFANNLINRTLGRGFVSDTLKRFNVEYPIPDNNTVHGDEGIKAAIIYYILCAICTPDPSKNISRDFTFSKDSGSIYWDPSMGEIPSDRQFWYWINTTSNTANFDRFIAITAKQLGFDSVQFTAEPNGSGWLAFEFVYVGNKIQWDDPKYPVKKVEKNWKGWSGVNDLSKIFDPFNPVNNEPCNFKQPQAMLDGRCDNPWGQDRPLCSFICNKQVERGIHRVVPQ
ncbi:hypothetical protein N9189_03020 [Pirellulaceae bacterium]|jgi:hypothetical protein|nr:hypothetical protein [Pirellulaceae bacterium]